VQRLRSIGDTLRTAVREWRAFGASQYRTYQGIGVTGAVTSALAGDGLTIPLLLYLGAHPAVATVIGVLPFACSAAQLAVPSLLRRSDGNLRLVTLAILAVGETRGFVLAAVTLLAWAEVIPAGIAIAAIAAVMSIGGAATTIGGTNLLAWYGAILPDPERRFVAPRVMGIALGLGAILLVPIALLVQGGLAVMGIRVYAIVFAFAGVAGVMELVVVRRLANPGGSGSRRAGRHRRGRSSSTGSSARSRSLRSEPGSGHTSRSTRSRSSACRPASRSCSRRSGPGPRSSARRSWAACSLVAPRLERSACRSCCGADR
jgi:hypothetical protein